MINDPFDDLRPYYESEINDAMQRIVANPLFDKVAASLFPNQSIDDVRTMIGNISTSKDFQIKVMYHSISQIAKNTMTQFTCTGLEKLSKTKSYLYISNHRDILLDSALLQYSLTDHGFNTSEITFGSNLMSSQFVVDIGKSNKMFKVIRGGSPRDFYRNSLRLSHYMRYTLNEKNESLWIAQRNGRTKDGNDQTDAGLIKMFSKSSKKELIENLVELNITPMIVSYQWETCIVSKVRELYISKNQKYEKAPGEDLKSIIDGASNFKGNVHIEVAAPINIDDLQEYTDLDKAEKQCAVTDLINKRIHLNYKLWDTNYIAFDIDNDSNEYLNNKYSEDARKLFVTKMDENLSEIEGDINELKKIYLGIYANPVKNFLKYS